jgi:hypothetical protein
MATELTYEQKRAVKDGLTAAFRELRKCDLIARRNFLCCQSCALASLFDELKSNKKTLGAVYNHSQDVRNFEDYGRRMAIRYAINEKNKEAPSARVLGQLVCAVLRSNGLKVQWSGSADEVIFVVGAK